MNKTAISPPSFRDLMLRNFAEIVRLDDAMQILCDEQKNGDVCDAVCPLLNKNGVHCNRKFLHGMIEDLKKEVPMLKLCPREQDGLCTGDEPCPHDCRKPGWECGLEDAALEAAEGYQWDPCGECDDPHGCDEICKNRPEIRPPPAMPEGSTEERR